MLADSFNTWKFDSVAGSSSDNNIGKGNVGGGDGVRLFDRVASPKRDGIEPTGAAPSTAPLSSAGADSFEVNDKPPPSASPTLGAIADAVVAAQTKSEWKPKRITRNQPGRLTILGNSFTFRPRGEMSVRFELNLSYIQERLGNRVQYPINSRSTNNRNLQKLNIGLFRRGVSSNSNAIISKEVTSYPINFANNCFQGVVPFYAPRSPGTFVFRLFFDDADSIVYQLATSQTMHCVVGVRDLDANLRFILSQFKAKKTSMAALHQLSDVLVGLVGSNQHHGASAGAARAAWGCVCEAKKVHDIIERECKQANASSTEIPKILKEDGEEDEELMASLKKEQGAALGALERKKRDVVVAVASVLEAALNNPATRLLFRPDQLQVIQKSFQLWCPLTEDFAEEEEEEAGSQRPTSGPKKTIKSLHKYQMEHLGFIPRDVILPKNNITTEVHKQLTISSDKIFDELCPSEEYMASREAVRKRLEKIVQQSGALPPTTKILVFGSSRNGFGTINSDLDMCLSLPDDFVLEDPAAAMGLVAESLEKAGMKEVNARLTSRIPIVMFEDCETGIECDISMQNPLAVLNTDLLRTYSGCDPRVRKLAYVIKRWVKARKINSPSNGTLSSYGYILMLLHFLQTQGVVPNLQRLPDSEGSRCNRPMKHPNETDFILNR